MFNILHGFFDPATGESYVVLKYKGKEYSGKARLHPDDKDKASNFAGCRFAEDRAMIKALKAEYKEKKAACEECRKFVKALQCYNNFDKDEKTAKVVFRQLNRRIKEVNDLADEINKLEDDLYRKIFRQTAVVNAINKNKAD